MTLRPALVLALAGSLLAASAASAQEDRPFAVSYDAANGFRPVVRVGGVLADPALEEAVRSGLPLRLRYKVELWKDGFFDDLAGSESWTTVVFYDPLADRFSIRTRASPVRVVGAPSFAAARAGIENAYALSIRPGRSGKYYYTATLQLETLSLSDLEELETWLKGELRPAIRGDGSVPGAVGAGVKRLLIRVLALPTRKFEARSGEFRVAGE